jgi:4-amino-4-deoxy-L-arabinose transferase-like glycosyltransferase
MKSVKEKSKKIFWFKIGMLFITAIYFLTHIIALTELPVFADEAIYIRWAQLIIDDWKQYLFFSMNDGKTPLFIWLITSALNLWKDPLHAGRMISVIVGIFQIGIAIKTVEKLKGGLVAQMLAAFSVMFLPFWYFHHRMALMDALLTLFLSCSFLFLIKAQLEKKETKKHTIISGVFLGLALFTKIPAILFFPALVLLSFIPKKNSSFANRLTKSAKVVLIGMFIFALLKLTPTFGQLFNRGGDFLYPLSELTEKGIFTILWSNIKLIFQSLFRYLSWPIMILPLFGLFQEKFRKTHGILILSFLGFVGPILLLGKTIYPRYIMPSIFPITISAALSFEYLIKKAQENLKKPLSFFSQTAFILFALTTIAQTAIMFVLISWQKPFYLPLVPIDRIQYLTEWSAGDGIKESTDLMLQETKHNSLAVATEGYFGTLPDGVLMYLHKQDVTGLMVEGIGQPVREIPEEFTNKARLYESTWLLVNSHREKMDLQKNSPELLIQEFCRGEGAPCLQLWDISTVIDAPQDKILDN